MYSYTALTSPRIHHMHTVWRDTIMHVSSHFHRTGTTGAWSWLKRLSAEARLIISNAAVQETSIERNKSMLVYCSTHLPCSDHLWSSTVLMIMATNLAQSVPHHWKAGESHVTTSSGLHSTAGLIAYRALMKGAVHISIDALPCMHTKFSTRKKHVVHCYSYSKCHASYCI